MESPRFADAVARAAGGQSSDADMMAHLCTTIVQELVDGSSPERVWEGATLRGLNSWQLLQLARRNPSAVIELQGTDHQ